ncbi:hypothetical protein SAMN05216232_3830 [Virgibacillus subterraneus]|uniref:Uncharacterized protein n=1 Tax=Virgibacillus subterraneus TaxID=621109 RepID=A0A1H9KBP9_9BACI|nr:hypothetical protein SAMN05216232_3830 [Virgibacillus subterraneus]
MEKHQKTLLKKQLTYLLKVDKQQRLTIVLKSITILIGLSKKVNPFFKNVKIPIQVCVFELILI